MGVGFLLLGISVSEIGLGGDWLRSSAITGAATAVDRTGNQAQSGLVLQVTPQFGLTGRSGRSMADVNYQLTMSLGLGSTDPRPLAHNLVAIGEVEAVEDFFFLGANAGARLGGTSSSLVRSMRSISTRMMGARVFFGVLAAIRCPLESLRRPRSATMRSIMSPTATTVLRQTVIQLRTRLHIGARSGRYFGPWIGGRR